METKLALYQLSAPCSSCNNGLGLFKRDPNKVAARKAQHEQRRATEGNFFKRNNISLDSVVNRANDLLDLAGGVSNIINQFKGGRPIYLDGKPASPEQARELYETAVAKEKGELESYLQNNLQKSDSTGKNSFLEEYMKMKMLEGDKKDNTPLYIGLGAGFLLVVVMMIMMNNKK